MWWTNCRFAFVAFKLVTYCTQYGQIKLFIKHQKTKMSSRVDVFHKNSPEWTCFYSDVNLHEVCSPYFSYFSVLYGNIKLTFTTAFHIFSLISWEHDNWITAKLCIECPWHSTKHTKLRKKNRPCSFCNNFVRKNKADFPLSESKLSATNLPSWQVTIFKDKYEELTKKLKFPTFGFLDLYELEKFDLLSYRAFLTERGDPSDNTRLYTEQIKKKRRRKRTKVGSRRFSAMVPSLTTSLFWEQSVGIKTVVMLHCWALLPLRVDKVCTKNRKSGTPEHRNTGTPEQWNNPEQSGTPRNTGTVEKTRNTYFDGVVLLSFYRPCKK